MGLLNIFKKKSKADTLPPISSDDELPELPPIEDTDLSSPAETFNESSMPEPHVVRQAPEPTPIMSESPTMEDESRDSFPHDLKHHQIGNSIFLNVDDYRTVLEHAESTKTKIRDAEEALRKLHKLKEGKEAELRKWQTNVADIQRKLTYVDKALFGNKH